MSEQVTITGARNGRYNENGTITADVQFSDSGGFLPYTAAEYDPAPYGPLLFADLAAGKYGPVTPFTATPEILAAEKARKYAEIKGWRVVQEDGDYVFQYDGRNWDYGKSSQDRMSISLAMARRNALPAGFAWTDSDNNIIPVDNAGLIALAAAIEEAMFKKGMQINLRQLQMKEEVRALTDLNAVRQYVVGWPPAKETPSPGESE